MASAFDGNRASGRELVRCDVTGAQLERDADTMRLAANDHVNPARIGAPSIAKTREDNSVRALDKHSKADRVYKTLLHRICKGEYRFGQQLSALAISREFDVSRQPVMAAIMRLEAEGFMSVRPQVSCNIATPSAKQIIDFFELFAVSEGLLARLAIERASPNDIPLLEAAERKIRAVPVIGTLPLSYGTFAQRFHAALHDLAEAPELKQRVESLWGLADFYINTCHADIDQSDIEQEHEERRLIVEAISSRDYSVEEMMRQHVRRKLYRTGPGKIWSD